MAPSVVLVVAVASLALAWMFGIVRMLTNGTGDGEGSALDAVPVRRSARGHHAQHGSFASLPSPRSPSFPG